MVAVSFCFLLSIMGAFGAPVEITVYGEQRVEQAKRELVESVSALGYGIRLERGDKVVYRHEAPWKGEFVVHDDGWTEFRRQPFRIEGREMPWATRNSAAAWAGCLLYPWMCVRGQGAMVGRRKFQSQKVRTLALVQPQVQVLTDAVADLSTARTVNGLPLRLQRLWVEGVPLEGEGEIESFEARREAILVFWETRTETLWGEQVRQAVEAFVREEVQFSDHPYTVAEIDVFNTRSHATRSLDLNKASTP